MSRDSVIETVPSAAYSSCCFIPEPNLPMTLYSTSTIILLSPFIISCLTSPSKASPSLYSVSKKVFQLLIFFALFVDEEDLSTSGAMLSIRLNWQIFAQTSRGVVP